MKPRVCVITGTRAEYGLLLWLLKELENSDNFELQLIVTGSHLSGKENATVNEVLDDGIKISATVDMMLASDTPAAVGKSLGLGVIGLSAEMERLKPSLVILLGDRFEALAAAQSAMVQKIPIAHIHGGEATEGLIDEAIRHSITKMSHLHFVAADEFKTRVIQLGENPANVHVVGGMGLDNLKNLSITPPLELEKIIGLSLSTDTFLVTYHPVTLKEEPEKLVHALLDALDHFKDKNIVFTGSNMDPSGQKINNLIRKYAARNSDRVTYVYSLGAKNYLSLMRYCSVVVGNSSSGLLEAPSVGIPTVNIGDRQRGRPRAPSVIDCDESVEGIITAIKRSMEADFNVEARKKITPYGTPGAAKRISTILGKIEFQSLLQKTFFNL